MARAERGPSGQLLGRESLAKAQAHASDWAERGPSGQLLGRESLAKAQAHAGGWAGALPQGLAMLQAPGAQARMRQAGVTVHVVGRLTPPVLSFVMPAVEAIAAMGTPQAVLFVDDAFGRQHAAIWPAGVAQWPVRDSASPWARSRALFEALRALAAQQPITVLHLHGLLPGLAAIRLLRRSADRAIAVFFSPHSSRALAQPTLVRAVVGRLLRLGLGHTAQNAIVNLQPEARLLAAFGAPQVQVVECPVPQVFFDTPRHEAKRPLLISGNFDGQRAAVDRYVRIAVLLNDERLGISFNWIGTPLPETAAALKAAGVGVFDAATDASRAQRLGAAWVYVAPTAERGFPIHLAEAMAAGLPCVALDTEVHRNLIRDGHDGYLCTDLRGLLQRIAQLVDEAPLRAQMGQAARATAAARFGEEEFRRQLWRAIGPPRALPSQTVPPCP